MSGPLIVCLCPTYKRPKMLASMVKCFESQTYENRFLIISDDAGTYIPQEGDYGRWLLHTTENRFPDLSTKYNALFANIPYSLVDDWANTSLYDCFREDRQMIISVWEDDDIYLPNYLERIANVWEDHSKFPYQFITFSHVFSNYSCPKDGTKLIKESAEGRFHASWAYTSALFKRVRGYKKQGELIFDQDLRHRCLSVPNVVSNTIRCPRTPSYVYRWGSGSYNGSQAGEANFAQFNQDLESLDCPKVGRLQPEFDKETEEVYRRYTSGELYD